MTPRTTTWRINEPGKPERSVDVPVPVSGSTEAARERHRRNTAGQAARYGYDAPSWSDAGIRREEDDMRERGR